MSATAQTREALALHGGTPVRSTFLPYGRQSIDEEDIQAVVDVLRSDWLTTGPKVGEFEEAFAARVSARYAVAFSSGTAALHGATFAAGIAAGDEVITTPLTFAASANCVLYQGGTPVFADVRRDTLNIDPDEVASRITPRTKALLPVDYAGHPADLLPLLETAEHNGLIVIEDACHALGAEYHERAVGSISHMTVFSFHPVKHLTTGEGGMVTTDNARFADTLRKFRNHGIGSDARERQRGNQWQYEMVLMGFNYRLPDVLCALGVPQVARLEELLRAREQVAGWYTERLEELVLVPRAVEGDRHGWQAYVVQLDRRDEALAGLREVGIEAQIGTYALHRLEAYSSQGPFPGADRAFERALALPFSATTTEEQVDRVCQRLTRYVSE